MKSLAEEIVDNLMKMYGPCEQTVDRIALMHASPDGTEVQLGGLCREAAIDRVSSVIHERIGM